MVNIKETSNVDRWADHPAIAAAANTMDRRAGPMIDGSKTRLERPNYDTDMQLAGLLSEVRIIAASVAEFALGARQGIAMEGAPHFFIVLEGECWLYENEGNPVKLGPGDSVATLRGDIARLGTASDVKDFAAIADIWRGSGSPPLGLKGFDMPLRLVCGGDEAACRLVGCAMIYSRSTSRSALIKHAPAVLHLAAEETGLADLAVAVGNGFKRQRSDRYGIASTAFAQYLLIEQLKAYVERDHERVTSSIAAGGGDGIWKLIHLLRQEPARAWSIASMAREAAMSRTRFIQMFGELTGMTPFRFLAACRMDHAAELLRTTRIAIEEIARSSGYRSERAFRAAFLHEFSMTPGMFRDAARNTFEASASIATVPTLLEGGANLSGTERAGP